MAGKPFSFTEFDALEKSVLGFLLPVLFEIERSKLLGKYRHCEEYCAGSCFHIFLYAFKLYAAKLILILVIIQHAFYKVIKQKILIP